MEKHFSIKFLITTYFLFILLFIFSSCKDLPFTDADLFPSEKETNTAVEKKEETPKEITMKPKININIPKKQALVFFTLLKTHLTKITVQTKEKSF